MASQLPDKLKKAELQRFALRAAQLEKFRPIVTYWSEYYILQQILSKGLHTDDEECSNYAIQLMDKLEKTKTSNATNDAITDDVAAKAYMENFALETFARAEKAQQMNSVNKQTADTFMAAATFLDLLAIWGEVDRELAAKSKFAKFHAARILRAYKAGEDPNKTNPVPVVEERPAEGEEELDAELRALEGQNGTADSGVYRPPTVESVVESAAETGVPSMPPSVVPSAPPPLTSPPPTAPAAQKNEYQVSPIETSAPTLPQAPSSPAGYFPTIPAPSNPTPMDKDQRGLTTSNIDPQAFYNTNAPAPAPAPSAPSPSALGLSSPARPEHLPMDQMTAQPSTLPPALPPGIPIPSVQTPAHLPVQQPSSVPQPPTQGFKTTGFNTDDESTMAAAKHARWAISALNFEDVNTAVKELRLALRSLGAS